MEAEAAAEQVVVAAAEQVVAAVAVREAEREAAIHADMHAEANVEAEVKVEAWLQRPALIRLTLQNKVFITKRHTTLVEQVTLI